MNEGRKKAFTMQATAVFFCLSDDQEYERSRWGSDVEGVRWERGWQGGGKMSDKGKREKERQKVDRVEQERPFMARPRERRERRVCPKKGQLQPMRLR